MPQTMVETSYCLVLVVVEGMGPVPRRSEVCGINGALSAPGYLLALLRDLLLFEVLPPKDSRICEISSRSAL